MHRLLVLFAVVLLVFALVPGWAGEERLALLGEKGEGPPSMRMRAVDLDPRDPKRRRVGSLDYLGGWHLSSEAHGFGGFSALAVRGRRLLLLSDGGNLASFTLSPSGTPQQLRFGDLPTGPGTGWTKEDRDSESLVIDPRTGQSWVGFENAQMIMRYGPGFTRAERWVRPAAMRRWPKAGGPEAMTRLPDGRFVVISEQARVPKRLWRGSAAARWRTREGLIWSGDPVTSGRPRRFAYRTEPPYDVADVAALPDGRLLVLERGFAWPFRFFNRVVLVEAGAVRPGALVRGRVLATLDAPLIHDNFEGIATSREGSDTIVWLISDDNGTALLQRTLLLRFRLRP